MRSLFFRVEDGTQGGGKSRLENFLRFLLFHSLDFCLALIALISFINIDVFHLGYFGLAGIYMRCRGHFWQGEYKVSWHPQCLRSYLELQIRFYPFTHDSPWTDQFRPFHHPHLMCSLYSGGLSTTRTCGGSS